MILEKVISGGQTGADQAGLYAAKDLGISTGGWAPKDWMTSNGPEQELLKSFGLIEHSKGYSSRTFVNVYNSYGTIRLATNFSSSGERCTLTAITRYKKPYFDIYLRNPIDPGMAASWIIVNKIKILNVAGNRDLKDKKTIFKLSYEYLKEVFEILLLRGI